MAENFCKEHRQEWFKRGKMKGFAHPMLDEDGNPTGEWCNKPKDSPVESVHEDKNPEAKMPGERFTQDPEKQRSIERQTSIQMAIDLCKAEGGRHELSSICLTAEYIYQWISKGTIPPKLEQMPPKSTTETLKEKTNVSAPTTTSDEDFEKLGRTEVEKVQSQKKPERDPKTIKNSTGLFKACKEDFGLAPQEVLKELDVTSTSELTDLPEAYVAISKKHGK